MPLVVNKVVVNKPLEKVNLILPSELFCWEKRKEKMKKQTGFPIIIWLAMFILVLSACNASANTVPTLIFESNKCSYSGPKTLPPIFTLIWKINESTNTEYRYMVVTLREDKTINDLKDALTKEGQPEWLDLISRDWAAQGNLTLVQEHNLTANGLYHGEPIYFACLSNYWSDAIGPITIKDQTSQ